MRSIRRVRRPLVALVALVLAVAIGYAVRTINAHDGGTPHPSPSVSTHR
ncbi:MAG TPA: hypothetical protein VFU35_05310 [Jatrophihabitans sp.]|nr:hypothetical protein [Jatrophihabitans sp.]